MPDAPTRPVDPDVDLHAPKQRWELRRAPWSTLAVISLGGVLGALARYGLSTWFPHSPTTLDWATLGINTAGCLLIGVLMVIIDAYPVHRLVRPFLGVGVLGGFTTFSTYVVGIQRSVSAHAPRTALLYLALTLVCALGAVWLGVSLARLAVRIRRSAGRIRS